MKGTAASAPDENGRERTQRVSYTNAKRSKPTGHRSARRHDSARVEPEGKTKTTSRTEALPALPGQKSREPPQASRTSSFAHDTRQNALDNKKCIYFGQSGLRVFLPALYIKLDDNDAMLEVVTSASS